MDVVNASDKQMVVQASFGLEFISLYCGQAYSISSLIVEDWLVSEALNPLLGEVRLLIKFFVER